MNHSNFKALFSQLAAKHYMLRDGKAKGGGDTTLRKRFFMSEEAAAKAIGNGITYPILIVQDYRGRLEQGTAVDDKMTCVFEVRKKVDDPHAFTQIDEAKDDCKKICMDLMAWMEVQMNTAPVDEMRGFDLNTVQYSFTGPTNDNEYGCLVQFAFEDDAFDPYTFDVNAKFSDEPIIIDMNPQQLTYLKTGNWSQPIAAGKVVQMVVVTPQENCTLKIGTALNGDELYPATSLSAGVPEVISLSRYFMTGGYLYFTTTESIDYKIYIY